MIIMEKIKKKNDQYFLIIRNISDDTIEIPMSEETEKEVREFMLQELELDGTLYGEVDMDEFPARIGFHRDDK